MRSTRPGSVTPDCPGTGRALPPLGVGPLTRSRASTGTFFILNEGDPDTRVRCGGFAVHGKFGLCDLISHLLLINEVGVTAWQLGAQTLGSSPRTCERDDFGPATAAFGA